MDDYNSELDDKLAAFTDSVLSGETRPDDDTESPEDLTPVVWQLHHLLASDQAGEDAVRARLRQRLAQEWAARPAVRKRRGMPWRTRGARLVMIAAALVVVLLGVLLLAGGAHDGGVMQGTASGSSEADWLPIGALLGVMIVGGVAVWAIRRHKS